MKQRRHLAARAKLFHQLQPLPSLHLLTCQHLKSPPHDDIHLKKFKTNLIYRSPMHLLRSLDSVLSELNAGLTFDRGFSYVRPREGYQ